MEIRLELKNAWREWEHASWGVVLLHVNDYTLLLGRSQELLGGWMLQFEDWRAAEPDPDEPKGKQSAEMRSLARSALGYGPWELNEALASDDLKFRGVIDLRGPRTSSIPTSLAEVWLGRETSTLVVRHDELGLCSWEIATAKVRNACQMFEEQVTSFLSDPYIGKSILSFGSEEFSIELSGMLMENPPRHWIHVAIISGGNCIWSTGEHLVPLMPFASRVTLWLELSKLPDHYLSSKEQILAQIGQHLRELLGPVDAMCHYAFLGFERESVVVLSTTDFAHEHVSLVTCQRSSVLAALESLNDYLQGFT